MKSMNIADLDIGLRLSVSKDRLLIAQMPEELRSDYSAMKKRVTGAINPDGSETYSLDGKPVIRFFPMKVETRSEGDSVKMIATQPYQIFDHIAGPGKLVGTATGPAEDGADIEGETHAKI